MRKIMISLGIAVAVLAGSTVTAQAHTGGLAGHLFKSQPSGDFDDISIDMTWTGDGDVN